VKLFEKKCVQMDSDAVPLTSDEMTSLQMQVPAWKIVNGQKLARAFIFADFKEALVFVNKVGEVAEQENHHPDIHIEEYKHVRIELSTHVLDGLSENDFILAAKIDQL
jgi:4a-hydroxytetrahydrobiopterin dehydratase